MVTLPDIRAAAERIRLVVRRTPLIEVPVGPRRGMPLLLKLENLQHTGAFKIRGASNCLALLNDAERAAGVIAASAGNHAQGVAAAASSLGVRAVIVMPEPTPLVKVDRTRAFGAEVVLHGDSFEQAYAHAEALGATRGLTFVHPFADERVIAGQGTIGLEILDQCADVKTVVVPVGGGGLIYGVACALKETSPGVRVIGVQTQSAPAMTESFACGQPVSVEACATIAEGIAVGTPCRANCEALSRYVDDMVLVDEAGIATAMLHLLEDHKLVVEGAGAAPYAAAATMGAALEGPAVLVVSGGNVDVTTLGAVINRGLAESGRSVRLLVELRDVPGALARLAGILSEARANIIEIFHNRLTGKLEVGHAEVELVLSTRGPEHIESVIAALCSQGYNARRHEHD